MKVFLSWSGQTSRAIAEILREWLPEVIQAVKPWLSSEDIDRGAIWNASLTEALVGIKAGIICVTRDNQEAPWLNFEAGALSKTVGKTMVCPYLLGIKPTELKWPLAQFHVSVADEDETFKLIKTLNSGLDQESLGETRLKAAFDRCWPTLKSSLANIGSSIGVPTPRRSQEELLEEILDLVRDQSRQSSALGEVLIARFLEATANQGVYATASGYLNPDVPSSANGAFSNLLALQALSSKAPFWGGLHATTRQTEESGEVDDEKPLGEE